MKKIIPILAFSFLLVGCRNTASSSSVPKEDGSSSKEQVSSNKEESSSSSFVNLIGDVEKVRSLLKEAITTASLASIDYDYIEKLPSATENTIKTNYKASFRSKEATLKKKGLLDTKPETIYQGLVNDTYYRIDADSFEGEEDFSSAYRYKVSNEAGEEYITRENAEKEIQAFKDSCNLSFLINDGKVDRLTSVSFMKALSEDSIQTSFSSTYENGYYEVTTSSYFEDSKDDDQVQNYVFKTSIRFDKSGSLVSGSVEAVHCAKMNWDDSLHQPKEGCGTFSSYILNSFTYGEKDTDGSSMISLEPYFISTISKAHLYSYMSGDLEFLRVGDTNFEIKIDSFSPENALDKDSITITSSSDETIIGKNDFGDYEALKKGTCSLVLGNAFNRNMYTLENVIVKDKKADITSFEGLDKDNSFSLKLGKKAKFKADVFDFDNFSPYDLDEIHLGFDESCLTASLSQEVEDGGYVIYLNVEGKKVSQSDITIQSGDDTLTIHANILSDTSKLTIEKMEGVKINGDYKEGTYDVKPRTKVSFYADPETGYQIDKVSLVMENKTSILTGDNLNKYTFTMPEEDCKVTFEVSKKELVTLTFNKPSYSLAMTCNLYTKDGTAKKYIYSGNKVEKGSTVYIELMLMSGYKVNKISLSDSSSVTCDTIDKLYHFTANGDLTITLDISKGESSAYKINATYGNHYVVDNVRVNDKIVIYSNRKASKGDKVEVRFYINLSETSSYKFASFSVLDKDGNSISFTTGSYSDTTYDDYDNEINYTGSSVTFTMPDGEVTVSATVTEA